MIQKYTISGDPVSKKNSQRIVLLHCKGTNGKPITRPMIAPSALYKKYEKKALKELADVAPFDTSIGPVNIKCIYYTKTLRNVDLTNLLEATDDILVKTRIIPDDGRKYVGGHDGSRIYHDKDNPRVEIEISYIEN